MNKAGMVTIKSSALNSERTAKGLARKTNGNVIQQEEYLKFLLRESNYLISERKFYGRLNN